MRWIFRAVIALTSAAALSGALPVAAADIPGLIFDTDICGDCDDVLALGMIHSLQSRGACRLLAVTVSVDNDLAAPFVDAVNTFYGRGDIPIGVVGKGGVVEKSKYLGLVEEKDDSGQFRYPHTLLSGKEAPPASQVLRKALAAQPDASVVIAQVGFSTNLARLLDSGPDESSPLTGVDLVKRKVKLLSLMAAPSGRSTATRSTWSTTSCGTCRAARSWRNAGRRPWSGADSRSGSHSPILRPASSATMATCRITRWPRLTSTTSRPPTIGRPGT